MKYELRIFDANKNLLAQKLIASKFKLTEDEIESELGDLMEVLEEAGHSPTQTEVWINGRLPDRSEFE